MTSIPGLQLRKRAADDLRENFLFLAQTNQTRANLFARSVQDAVTLLIAQPFLGSPRFVDDPRLRSLRRWPLKDFKQFGVFYRPFASGNGVEVWAVLHSSRDYTAHLKAALEMES